MANIHDCRCDSGCICDDADIKGFTIESQVDHFEGDPICRCGTSDGCVCTSSDVEKAHPSGDALISQVARRAKRKASDARTTPQIAVWFRSVS